MDQLRTWRKSLGIKSLEQAGLLLGVSAVQMHRYEAGTRRIPAERVLDVARITGIPKEELRPDLFKTEAAE